VARLLPTQAQEGVFEMDPSELPKLTEEEQQRLERLLNPPGARSRRYLTVDLALGKWRSVVSEVERGYAGNADDYWYDLTWRDRLDVAMTGVPEETQRKIAQALGLLDERFKRVTVPDESDLLGQYYRHGEGWWWRRLPTKVHGLLAQSFGFERNGL
jgi:hypothetical protein